MESRLQIMIFKSRNYNEIVEELGSDIKVFPGAEVKLKGVHLLVIAAPEDAEYLSEGLVKLKQIKI
ncbi:Uncharacterised protein [Weissella viridescens]|uniref:Uncharacterized protein n=1 Tax=Weissella viridescens TaxID=1629 RepID=A0A380NXQ0_WEIVI|nr:Uncharacterised protein [Weissella viridescens]